MDTLNRTAPAAARWTLAHPTAATAAAAIAAVLAVTGALLLRHLVRHPKRPPAAVLLTAAAAAACTAYSADTSYRYAAHHLGMRDTAERAMMFSAAELALLACSVMARHNVRSTGRVGAAGTAVWALAAVQVVPAVSESGPVAGAVRAIVGPIGAVVMLHLALGLELRHHRPDTASQALGALLAREARERLLARLGLSQRGRDAQQIAQDHALHRAVALADRLAHQKRDSIRGRRTARRLAAAVHRTGAGTDPTQRDHLLAELAARRAAPALATLALPSPWTTTPTGPRSVSALAHHGLRALDQVDAVHVVARAHPTASHEELASLLTEHGIVVSPTQVSVALRATASAPHLTAVPNASDGESGASGGASAAGQGASGVITARIPDPGDTEHDQADQDDQDEDDALLAAARAIDTAARNRTHRPRPASLRTLQMSLGIGQARAQELQRLLAAERSAPSPGRADEPDAPLS